MPHGPFNRVDPGDKYRSSHINELQDALEETYTSSESDATYADKTTTEAAIARVDPGSAGTTGQVSGWNDDGDPVKMNIRAANSQVQDFSGMTYFFVPPRLDIRAFGDGAVTNAEATALGLSTAAKRARNSASIQAAITASTTSIGNGTRRVLIPGSFGEVYEFDTTITYPSGVCIVTEHEEPIGAQLHYYGAVNTDAFQPIDMVTVQSYAVFAGVRLEDKRGSAAATGTGCGLNLTKVGNGVHIENCFVEGFYNNLHFHQNDMIRVTGGWVTWAHNYGIYLSQCLNFNYIKGVALETVNAEGPTQVAMIYVTGGGMDNHLLLESLKSEGDVAAAHGIVLNAGIPTTTIDGWSFRGAAAGMADMVRLQGTAGNGIGQSLILQRISTGGGLATNLLRVVPSDGGDYALPSHASQASAILNWTPYQREVTNAIRPTYTQAASGTTTAGTVAMGTGAGTSPTLTVNGDDQRGVIELTTGTSPAASNQIFSFNFRVPWPLSVRSVLVSPANANAAALSGTSMPYTGALSDSRISRTFWRFYSGSAALAASTAYKWHYEVLP